VTRAVVESYIGNANALLAKGDCAGARETLGQAWLALSDYSTSLAQQGVSPSRALKLHSAITKALVKASRTCNAQMNGIAETYSNAVPYIGFVLAAVGLGIGIWSVGKR
jgi:hypothetical protein